MVYSEFCYLFGRNFLYKENLEDMNMRIAFKYFYLQNLQFWEHDMFVQ